MQPGHRRAPRFRVFGLSRGTLLAIRLYAPALLLFLLLRALPGELPWPLAWAANLLHLLLLPAPLLVLVGLVRRRALDVALGAALCVPLATTVRDLGLLEPAPANQGPPPPAASELRVLTLNLGGRRSGAKPLGRLLRDQPCDLVGLQELSWEMAGILERDLADVFPHRALQAGGVEGRGLLSRHPILDSEWFQLESWRPHLRVRVAVDGRPLTVLVEHIQLRVGLVGRGSSGGRDLRVLARGIPAGEPTLLVGDLNTTPRSEEYAFLREHGLSDAFGEVGAGPGWTFPIERRFHGLYVPRCLRIDYVWSTAELEPVRSWIGPDVGSDHMPLFADLRW